MFILKVILWALAAVVGLAALGVLLLVLQFQVVYPWKYSRFEKEAAAWNAQQWEEGTALQVTVEVTASASLGGKTATAKLDCYTKQFPQRGGIKGPPGIWPKTIRDGADGLVVAFGEDATHETPLRDVCWEVPRLHKEWVLPHTTESGHYWTNVIANDLSFQCFLGRDARTTRGEVSRPVFTKIEEVPLRQLISREAFDALARPNDRLLPRRAPSLSWRVGERTSCWSDRLQGGSCVPRAEEICGRPLERSDG